MDEFDKPNLTEQELFEYLYYDEDLPVTRRLVHYAVLAGDVVPTKMGNKNFFSRRDGIEWIKSRKGIYRSDSMHYKGRAAVGE